MNSNDFILDLKNFINSEYNTKMNDTKLLILYLELGNSLKNYIKLNKLNRDQTLSLIFTHLKAEFDKVQICNLKGVKALYQLSLDYSKLDIIKELLKQISITNKILVMQNAKSIEAMITNINNSIKDHSYIDKHTKSYYYGQLENRKNAEFMEVIKLIYVS